MKKKKPYKKKYTKSAEARERLAAYEIKKEIHFFNSFEEENEFTARQRASLSYDERMKNIEQLRKMVFSKYLLDNGSWPPIAKVFKIMKPYTNDPQGFENLAGLK